MMVKCVQHIKEIRKNEFANNRDRKNEHEQRQHNKNVVQMPT